MGRTTPPPATKTYILELTDGNTRRITIPAHWKLTFGSVVPFTSRNAGHYDTSHRVALRMYEGNKENLRAVMTDVTSIRDADIVISEKRTSVKRQAAQKQTSQGMKDIVVEARVTEWVNPDDDAERPVPEEFLKLPGGVKDGEGF